MPAPIPEVAEAELTAAVPAETPISQPESIRNDANSTPKSPSREDLLSDGSTSDGCKDSGCELAVTPDDEAFQPPNAELAAKIVQQVEFYFSDANICKDAFLLKHVRRNKEGYVSLKLISSFKRVKHLTKDWRVVAHALTHTSSQLQVNEQGTKIRRLEPLPQFDETTPSRTIVAVNMPLENVTIESVAEMFKKCGEIVLVRILRPGNPIPADVRQFLNKNPSLAGTICALVEFVVSEAARKAIQIPKTDYVTNPEFQIYELKGVPSGCGNGSNGNGATNQKSSKKNAARNGRPHSYQGSSDNLSSSEIDEHHHRCRPFVPHQTNNANGIAPLKRRGSANNFISRHVEPAAWLQRRLSASSTEANFFYLPRRLSYSSRDSSESSLAALSSRRTSTASVSSHSTGSDCSRRQSTTSDYSNSGRSRSNSAACLQPDNVLRMPKGPDGSKGFRIHNSNRFGMVPTLAEQAV